MPDRPCPLDRGNIVKATEARLYEFSRNRPLMAEQTTQSPETRKESLHQEVDLRQHEKSFVECNRNMVTKSRQDRKELE